jgi:signal transduction histidine kinase
MPMVNESWEKKRANFKSLLARPNISVFLGDVAETLFIGFISKINQKLGKPVAFFYKDENAANGMVVIDGGPYGDKYICLECCTPVVSDVIDSFAVYEGADTPCHIYRCCHTGHDGWILPVYIEGCCIGAFATDEVSSSDRSVPEFTCEWLRFEINNNQKMLSQLYDDAFMNYESHIRRRLYNIVMGKKSLYEGVERLKTQDLGDLFRRYRLIRSNLFDSAVLMKNIFGIEELAVYRPLSDPDGLQPHDIIGVVLTNEAEKSINDNLNFDRPFLYTDTCLSHPIEWSDESNSSRNKCSQTISLLKTNDTCRAYMIKMADRTKNITPETKHNKASSHCNKRLLNDLPPCGECDNILCSELSLAEMEGKFNNCFLAIYATKGYKDYPVAFAVRYTKQVNGTRRTRFMNSLLSITEYMSTAFLSQWNMLTAEYSSLKNDSVNLYRKHESRQVVAGFIGLTNKLNNIFIESIAKMTNPGIRPALSDVAKDLNYNQEMFIKDQTVFMNLLNVIVDNMDAMSEGFELKKTEFNLYETILNRLRMVFRYRINDRDTRQLHLNKLTKVVTIYADSMRLEQVISNMVENAIKYSYHSTNVYVWVDSRINLSGGEEIYISVTSYGPEIPQSEWEKIFTFGYRYNPAGVQNYEEGTGLGLFIARRFARLHDGDIKVTECTQLSNLYIPYIKYYLDSGETQFAVECDKLNREYWASGLYKEVVNTEHNTLKMRPTKGSYVKLINKPTYRVVFTLTLPIIKKGE